MGQCGPVVISCARENSAILPGSTTEIPWHVSHKPTEALFEEEMWILFDV